jgi:hypothetical protein
MNIKNFKSGVFKQQYQYKSFSPALVNHVWIWEDPKINTLLSDADRALGELDAFSLIVPDKLIKQFQNTGILVEVTGFRRSRLFEFKGYFTLFTPYRSIRVIFLTNFKRGKFNMIFYKIVLFSVCG